MKKRAEDEKMMNEISERLEKLDVKDEIYENMMNEILERMRKLELKDEFYEVDLQIDVFVEDMELESLFDNLNLDDTNDRNEIAYYQRLRINEDDVDDDTFFDFL